MIRLVIPDDLYFRAAVIGQIQQLSYADQWQNFGTVTADQTADFFNQLTEDLTCETMEIGDIFMTVRNVPENCLNCDGHEYNKADYPLLYAALPAHMRISATKFVTPDLGNRYPRGLQGGSAQIGTEGGENTHTLTIDEMPSHNHTPPDTTETQEYFMVRRDGSGNYFTPVANGSLHMQIHTVTAARGGGQAHNNEPAYTTLRFCIVAK